MDAHARRELQELLTRLADGERAAFDRAFALLWPVLRDFCRRALPGPDGEDAAQGALVDLFERADEFDPALPALPWALGIAAWHCRTLRKRAQRRREDCPPRADAADALEGSGAVAPSADPETAAIEQDLRRAAAELLGDLRGPDVETLLCLSRGERPGVAPATFRKRAERALQRFRAAWRARHGID